MAIVDNAVYVDGRRVAEPESLDDTYELLRDRGGIAWIGLYRPDRDEIDSVAKEFSLHELAVEDAVKAHQRPKLERDGDVLFTVLRPARYVDAEERVEFGELHVFTGRDFVVTIRHAETPDLAEVRRRLEAAPDLIRLGPEAVLYVIFDQVVDEYAPVVAGLENDIDEIEDQLFKGDHGVSRRIYQRFREVVDFQRATKPLVGMLGALRDGFEEYDVDPVLRRYLRRVEDHTLRVVGAAEGFRVLLQSILTVNSILVGQAQNEEIQRLTEASLRQNGEVKRISAWAAILFAPTLVGTIYGMNFEHMPELSWTFGYPFSILLMSLVCVGLYLAFKRKGWL